MKVTNSDTVKAYDNGVQAYFDLSPQKVSAHIKNWIDASLEGLPTSASIFEIGSGTGKDADYMESLGYQLQLSDASTGFVDFLRQKGETARVFNILTDDFDVNYDLIFADAVLLHFTERELRQVIQKISSSLKPAGRFAFTIKQGEGEFMEEKKLGALRYFHLWQPAQLKAMLEDCQMDVRYEDTAEDSRGNNKPAWVMMIAEKRSDK